MATKAELEAELADLRAQLKVLDEQRTTERDEAHAEDDEPVSASVSEALALDLPEGALQDLAKEVEALAKEKPLVTILAAFVVGYIIGRGR